MTSPTSLRTPRKLRALLLVALATAAPLVGLAGVASAQSPEPERSEPSSDAWTWEERPAPTFARIGLRIGASEVRLAAGEQTRVDYVVTNDGDAPADVRVALSPHGRAGISARILSGGEHALAPGESARGVIELRAARDASGVHFLHLEANVIPHDDNVIALTSIAFLNVHVALPQPAPESHACTRTWGWMRLPAFAMTHCWRPAPPPSPMMRAAPSPFMLEPPAPPMLVPFERAPAREPCHHEPPTVRGDGTLLLHLVLHGRIEGGRLVIDLDDSLRALLAPVVVEGEMRARG